MQHLAIIMDGNRRWAKNKGIKGLYGKESKESVRTTIRFCLKNNIKHLSLYTFSLENFNRSRTEQEILFSLLISTMTSELPGLIEQGVKIKFVGDKNFFPNHVKPIIEKAESKTKSFSKLNLNILFCYGGRQELISATKSIAQKVKSGELEIDNIDDNVMKQSLWTEGTPDPDLVVRTGKTFRISNFLTYQSVYSEFAFLDCYWPEITEDHLNQCVSGFLGTKRNFGY